MNRALRFLALLSAFFVVAVRCLGGFPLALACIEALPDLAASASTSVAAPTACPTPAPSDEDTMAPIAASDDSDDGAEAALTPSSVEVKLHFAALCSGSSCSALANERALPSHAPSLERLRAFESAAAALTEPAFFGR